MEYTRLYLWVEGSDDVRLVNTVIKPRFEERYDFVRIIEYAQEAKKKINNYLRSIKAMGADYVFFTDNDSLCITLDKQKRKGKYCQLEEKRILVVVKEIESWYLAGLDDRGAADLGIRSFRNTDAVTKEQFDDLIPRAYDSRIDFMLEILKRFVVKTATTKNKSFQYFVDKYSIPIAEGAG